MSDAISIYKASNNTHCWQDAMEKELGALLELDCFEFKSAGYHQELDDTWQRTALHMVFEVKHSLERKA